MGSAVSELPGTRRSRLEMAGRLCGDRQGAFWGYQVGQTPTDRAKNGVKRSLLGKADSGPLVLPTLKRVRYLGKRAVCLNSVWQIALAWFVDDVKIEGTYGGIPGIPLR